MNMPSIAQLQSLDPVDFEKIIAALLVAMGFNASTTKTSGDGGIDVIAINEQPIFSGKYVIQCKRYATPNNVGESAIRELYGVMHSENANKGILISTSNFTKQAITFSQNKAIELINGDDLIKLIHKYLDKIDDVGQFATSHQAELSNSKAKKFLEDYYLLIEREKVKKTKRHVELLEYAKLTNPGSAIRNEFMNIFNFHSELNTTLLKNIFDKMPSDNASKEECLALFCTSLECAITDPSNKAYVSLLDDYYNKTFKFFLDLIGINPPLAANSFHSSLIDFAENELALFSLLREYKKPTTSIIEKGYYGSIIFHCLRDFYAKAERAGTELQEWTVRGEAELQNSPNQSSSCFVATAVYVNYDSPELIALRDWRDNYLSQKLAGQLFIKFYYIVGPMVAKRISSNQYLKRIVKSSLDRFVCWLILMKD